MNSVAPRPLPNAADKAALKVLAAHVILACPSLHDTAHEVAAELLVKHGLEHLDPDQVYFHRFKAAQSSSTSFTGWQHSLEKPYESLTLTQLVIHRFRATDQDNADLLDLYAGFYTEGAEGENFNETNEVHLHGNEVLKAFWDLNFSDIYRNKLRTFWNDYSADFRTLAKCNFLSHAVDARESGQLTDDDFQTAIKAVIGPLTWPVRLKMLQTETAPGEGLCVAALEVAGHVAVNLLRIVDAKGRQIVYVPGDTQAFEVFETASELHWWVLNQMNKEAPRRAFLNHFPLADRQAISENITDLLNRLVSTWGHADHHLINQTDQTITADAFSWLRDATRTAMFAEADLSLTSNGDLRKKLWIGYLSAGLKLFGPMAAVGWPVALPVIGASLASMGLNIDQAVNGKTASERKDGVIGAVFSAIDVLFNLPFLKGVGSEAEVGAEVDAAEAAEWDEYKTALDESAAPKKQLPVTEATEGALPPAGEIASVPSEAFKATDIPQAFETNELLDSKTPISESGKFQGIYKLESDPPYAILMNDTAYYVRYFPDSRGGGYWAIIDPARPNQFIHSLPVRLNAEGAWERMPKLRLPGGGQCLGKTCAVELDMDEYEGDAPPHELPRIDPPPPTSTSRALRLVTTPYDVEPHTMARLKRWALGLRDTHVQVRIGANGAVYIPDRYALNFAGKAQTLLSSARQFYRNLDWSSLPLRPHIPAIDRSMTFATLIKRVFDTLPGLVIGETLDRITSMRLMIEDMPTLASQGVKTIYMRRLLADFAQVDLNDYFNTGEMSEELETYLTQLGTDPDGRFNELELVKTARARGIRVQALDCAANYLKPTSLTSLDEQMIANHLANEIMFSDRVLNGGGKWVVLTGAQNTNTFRGLAGISELEGGVGVRIEEVYPGQGHRLEIDPGIEVGRGPIVDTTMSGKVDTLYADLRLQVEAPPVNWIPGQSSRLLSRKGMYLFEKVEGAYTLIHRSSNGSIVGTAVEPLAHGNYCIIRPEWTQISGVPFASIDRLSQALTSMGMVLQSRIPD